MSQQASALTSGTVFGVALGGSGTANTPQLPISYTTFVCNGASAVTVAAPQITASSIVIPCLQTVGGTVGAIPAVKTITPGTGFTIAGTASDTSTYGLLIIG